MATTSSAAPATNYGRLIQLISGVNGVAPSSQGIWLPPPNRRYHRCPLKCTGQAAAGGTNLSTIGISTTGTGLTVNVTVNSAGLLTAVAIHSAGTGYTAADTVTYVDANYPPSAGYVAPATITIATVSSGVPQTLSFVTTPVATQPALVFGANSIQLQVNSVIMRNLSAAQILGIIAANPYYKDYTLQPGELPLLFTEPPLNILQRNDVTSWDLFGQTPQFNLPISAAITNPGIAGSFEFDYMRNARKVNGVVTPFLNPVKHLVQSTPVPAGFYDWTTLPINFPIRRIWFIGSTPGQITRLTLIQDGNTVLDSFTPEITELYGEYGFDIPGLNNTANALSTTWDAAFISDPDGRLGKALKVSSSLITRVYSGVAQTITAVMEVLPQNYA